MEKTTEHSSLTIKENRKKRKTGAAMSRIEDNERIWRTRRRSKNHCCCRRKSIKIPEVVANSAKKGREKFPRKLKLPATDTERKAYPYNYTLALTLSLSLSLVSLAG